MHIYTAQTYDQQHGQIDEPETGDVPYDEANDPQVDEGYEEPQTYHTTIEPPGQHQCRNCNYIFNTKNALFRHIYIYITRIQKNRSKQTLRDKPAKMSLDKFSLNPTQYLLKMTETRLGHGTTQQY